MALDIGTQVKKAQLLNQAIKNIAESSRSWAAFSQAMAKNVAAFLDSQEAALGKTNALAEAQKEIENSLIKQTKLHQDIGKIIDKQAPKFRGLLGTLKEWGVRLKEAEKSAGLLGRAFFHSLGKINALAIKVGKTLNNMFSLKGAIKLLKVGFVTILGMFTGLVATVKSVGNLLHKHLSNAFKGITGVVKTGAGLVVSFFRKIWDTITMGGGEIRAAVAEMAQALGFFNREMGQAMGFLQANRRSWYQMGLSVGEAAKYVIELNKHYGRFMGFGPQMRRMYKEHIMMSRALGLDAESAGKLGRVLSLMNSSMKEFTMNLVGTLGPGGPLESMGAIIPQIAKDIAESGDSLALMGEEGKKTFVAGAIWVRQYNIAIKDLQGLMDKFDTLSSASENVSKLNQMFGTTINSIEMLTETDPAGRLEKIRNELLETGKNWENMDYFQRKALTSMMGIGAEQAEILFSSKQIGKSRQEIARAMEAEDKRQRESQQRQAEVMKAILSQLQASRGIMGSIMPIFYRVWVAFGKVFGQFLRGGRRGLLQFAEGWAKGIRQAIDPLTEGGREWTRMSREWSRGWQKTMKDLGNAWGQVWAKIDMKKFGEDFYGTINSAVDAIKQIIKDLFPDWANSAQEGADTINNVIHGIATRLQGMFKWLGENGADIIRNIGKVARGAFDIVKKIFNFFDKSNWSGAANIMKDLFKVMTDDAAKILGYTSGIAGNLTKGIDPAMAAATLLQKTYMGIRDLVIDIHDWWKKNGDEIKNTIGRALNVARPFFQLAMTTGKYVGKIFEFLAKHPALLEALAVVKAGSFVTRGLFGMGMGQVVGAAMGGGRGGAAASFLGGAGADIGRNIAFGRQMSWDSRIGAREATNVLGRGAVGAGIGGAIGGAIGGGRGAAVGAGAGAGVGVGSTFGPIGALVGGLAGAVSGAWISSIQKENEEIEAHNNRIKAMLREADQRFAESLWKETEEVIKRKTEREKEFELIQRSIRLRNTENERMRQQIDILNDQRGLDLEKLRTDRRAATLRGDTGEAARIRQEISQREALDIELEKSIAYKKAENAIAQQQLYVRQQENIYEQEKLRLEPEITSLEEQRQAFLQTQQDKLATTLSSLETFKENLAGATTQADYDAILNAAVQTIEKSGFTAEVKQSMLDAFRGERSLQVGQEIETARGNMVGALERLSASMTSATEAGKFDEAIRLRDQILSKQNELGRAEQRVADARGQMLGYELKVTETLAKALTDPVNIANPANLNSWLESNLPAPPTFAPLAFGGLVKSATRALIGEAGPELAIPMRDGSVASGGPGTEAIITDYLNKITGGRTRTGGGEQIAVAPIVLNIDGRRVAESLVRVSHRSV